MEFKSLQKHPSKRTVLSKNHKSIKSLHTVKLFDNQVLQVMKEGDKQRSISHAGMAEQIESNPQLNIENNLKEMLKEADDEVDHLNVEVEEIKQESDKVQLPETQGVQSAVHRNESRGRSTEGESNYENKILVQYKENLEIDDELKVINKIYDRFYNSQKPPTKIKSKMNKYYRFIPSDPLFKDYSVYTNKQSFLQNKKATEDQYKMRHANRQQMYFSMLDQKVRGIEKEMPEQGYAQRFANPAFKYLGLSYRDNEQYSMLDETHKQLKPKDVQDTKDAKKRV